MIDRNLKLALHSSLTFLAASIGATAILVWMTSELSADGTAGFLTVPYIAVLIIGLAATFLGGYFYDSLLSRSTLRYARTNSDIPKTLLRSICKGRLLSRWYGYASAICLLAATLIFCLKGEAGIQLICLLTAMGCLALFFSLHYYSRARQLRRQRFRRSV